MKNLWQRAVDEDWFLALGVLLAIGAPNLAIVIISLMELLK